MTVCAGFMPFCKRCHHLLSYEPFILDCVDRVAQPKQHESSLHTDLVIQNQACLESTHWCNSSSSLKTSHRSKVRHRCFETNRITDVAALASTGVLQNLAFGGRFLNTKRPAFSLNKLSKENLKFRLLKPCFFFRIIARLQHNHGLLVKQERPVLAAYLRWYIELHCDAHWVCYNPPTRITKQQPQDVSWVSRILAVFLETNKEALVQLTQGSSQSNHCRTTWHTEIVHWPVVWRFP